MDADNDRRRQHMVEHQLTPRGITDVDVLAAFLTVPREAFVPAHLSELAYDDAPLPIAENQTISQPYIVAFTTEALGLRRGDRVLEIGTGSGYAAAILGQLATEVFTVERHAPLAEEARARLARLGRTNVHVLEGDGTLGWPDHAPYDAIAVAAGGPEVPQALLDQLAPGGRLVMPVGSHPSSQQLTRVTRIGPDAFRTDTLGSCRFVPLIGAQGWPEDTQLLRAPKAIRRTTLAALVAESAEPFAELGSEAAIDALVERIGGARVVLLGEATHGTSEFYRMRAHITRALIQRHGFDFVAVEADWPDAARIDDYVLGTPPRSRVEFTPFSRFPTWMWRNREVEELVGWMRAHNFAQPEPTARAGFHGLDLYSMFTSMAVVLGYLEEVDPDAARLARARYGALTPFQTDPAAYGHAVLIGRLESAEEVVVAMLRDLLARRLDYALRDGDRFFDAAQNARVVAGAEQYYRAMYHGSVVSWNLRDTHMFETLQALLAFYGPNSRGIVWEHNSHVGNAAATEMGARGEHNVGQLCRMKLGDAAYAVGFGTDHGTVAAASAWDEPMQRMSVRPAHGESYERVCHDTAVPAFMLHLRDPVRAALRDELVPPRLERAIGVVYRPDTELMSHYFQASLPHQFDEWIWLDETHAVDPLPAPALRAPGLPETYPFGL